MNKKLRCLDVIELVTDYVENALPAEERRRFEDHVAAAEARCDRGGVFGASTAAKGAEGEREFP